MANNLKVGRKSIGVNPHPKFDRTIAKSLRHPVILSKAKNLTHARETLRSAQGDNARDFAIVLDIR